MHTAEGKARQLVWDLPTRIFHWGLAVSFMGAYLLSESERLRAGHVMFGYTVLGLVAFRLLWGFIGSRFARFTSFAYGPGKALGYLRDLASGRAAGYSGHNPAGSWALYLLLALALATGVTGWLNFNKLGGEGMEEVHEFVANAWLIVVFVHVAGVVAGVVAGRLAHGRNFVATMVTGYRRGGEAAGGGSRVAVGVSIVAAVVAFWTWSLTAGGPDPAGSVDLTIASLAGSDHDDRNDHDEDDD